jgi:hypothetical protein
LCTHWHTLSGIEHVFDKLVFYRLAVKLDCNAKRYVRIYLRYDSLFCCQTIFYSTRATYLYGYRITHKKPKHFLLNATNFFFQYFISLKHNGKALKCLFKSSIKWNISAFSNNLMHEPFLFITQNHIEYQRVIINRNGEIVRHQNLLSLSTYKHKHIWYDLTTQLNLEERIVSKVCNNIFFYLVEHKSSSDYFVFAASISVLIF